MPTEHPTTDPSAPNAPRRRGMFVGSVTQNVRICTDHYRLTLRIPHFPPSIPGQFVQLECAGTGAGAEAAGMSDYLPPAIIDWTPGTRITADLDPDYATLNAYLRRPFSIAARRDTPAGTEIDIIHRVVGRGTAWLAGLCDGTPVSVLGPLGGRGFHLTDTTQVALLVGGGVGIPPMFYLAEALARVGRRAVAFVGAQRADLVPLTISPCMPAPSAEGDPVLNATEFADHGFPTVITTDDGSMGMKGFVTTALQRFLEKNAAIDRRAITVYCCGPTPMMKATARVAAAFDVACQVSLEQPMACGMGTCQSCVVRERNDAGPDGWVYKLTCTDGPVWDARALAW